MAKPMGAYRLGEVYAQNMGVNLHRFRAALILVSSVLSACVTAFAGPVSFVGIAVPHLAKRLFGTSSPLVLIPGCFLGGSVFCLFCDRIARTRLFAGGTEHQFGDGGVRRAGGDPDYGGTAQTGGIRRRSP